MERTEENTETAIHIVDKDYRIIHFNRAMEREFPGIKEGDECYRALCGEREPCSDCPLNEKNRGSRMLYNKKIQQWTEVTVGAAEWPGVGPVNIIFSRGVRGGNEDLFYSLTNTPSYDELFELNLTKGTYKVLYHKAGKYVVPNDEGELASGIRNMAEHMIHPEDKEAFLEFWNLDDMMPQLLEQPGGRMLSGQFRKRLAAGDYCWVSQRVVPLLKGDQDDEILMCFVQDIQEEKEKELASGEKSANAGRGAGVYRRSVFWKKAEQFLKKTGDAKYCLMAIDIEHFKLFNEWYGQKAGDGFLENISLHLKKAQEEHGGLAGYMGDDDFCIILPDDKAVLAQLQNQIMGYVKRYAGNAGFLPAFGIYRIEDTELAVSMMYDRAVLALASVKGNYAQRASWYDTAMMKKMEEDHVLLAEVQRALEKKEFTFYAQPKCDMRTGKIIGLESLVRWNHPTRGIIPPGEFITLLENNGFISNLDLYVWEQVCFHLKRWLDAGHTAVPISVNVSRIDLYTLDVVSCFIHLTEKYGLEPRLIEVEITESAYAEEYKAISKVVDDLQKAGFTVLMDDFGSGYSSLNMLKDVNVDILKIDMKFLETNENNGNKGMEILEAIIRMAQLMRLRVIAEGVETKEQVEMLLEMGCNYAQGYYFYRPMPKDMFEAQLMDENNIEPAGIEFKEFARLPVGRQRFASSQRALETVAQIADNDKAFMRLTEENRRTAEAIFAQITPGGMIGGYCEEGFPLYFANSEMLRLLGYNTYEEFEKAIDGKVVNTIHPDDLAQVTKDIGPEYYAGLEYTTTYRMPKKDGSWFWTLDKGKVIQSEDGRLAIVSACMDLSETMEIQMQLTEKNEELVKKNQELYFLNNDMPGGYHRCVPTADYEFVYISNRFLDIFGYTREEIKELFDNKFMNMVHPDDRRKVLRESNNLIESKESLNLEYRMSSKRGYIWVIDQSKYMETEGIRCIQGVVMDATETVELRNQMKLLRDHAPESIFLIYWSDDNLDIRVLASGLHRNGARPDKEQDIKIANRLFQEIIEEQDYGQLEREMTAAMRRREDYRGLFREIMPGGEILWVNLEARYISEGPKGVKYLCLFGDVTDIKHKEKEIWLTGQKLESILRQATINCWDWDITEGRVTVSNVVKNKVLSELYPAMANRQAMVENMPEVVTESPYIPEKYRKRILEYTENVRNGKPYESYQCELPVTGKNGETAWIRSACETICNEEGKPIRAVGYYIDITEQKKEYLRSKENIKVLQQDALTGLYNRQTAIPEIKRYLEKCEGQDAAMIMLDMDNFKVANDVFGHAYGDEIIAESAEKLQGYFRGNDIVCRIGGDEFLVLCKNIREEDVERKMSSVVQAMKIHCQRGGREIVFTVSAGYALIPGHGKEFDELYRKADIALFNAKTEGKGTYRKYSASMKEIRYELERK